MGMITFVKFGPQRLRLAVLAGCLIPLAAVEGNPSEANSPAALPQRRALASRCSLGNVLSRQSREKLESWMIQNVTGDSMIRAGTLKGWRIGDKTGSNRGSISNDIAILRPPAADPILLVVYVEAPGRSADDRAKFIAATAAEWLKAHWRR